MSDFVTQDELRKAIDEVHDRINETEELLRKEFTDTIRFEMNRQDVHLGLQDKKLDKIQWWVIATLLTIIVAVISMGASGLHIST